jgi:bifunctional aspartokinase / homoserine dehydrogenase 1
MIVMKFGGTSVGDANCIANAADIVAKTAKERGPVVVVVSAMSGVTNSLIAAATAAARQKSDNWTETRDRLLTQHQAAVVELASDVARGIAILDEIRKLLDDFASLCQSIAVLGELTPRGLDVVSSFGERMMVRIFAEALLKRGLAAEPIEATELIITDDNFGNAAPLPELTRESSRERICPLLDKGVIPVVTGFIGRTADGVITTLGRGGSDYTAAILAECLDSEELWIWTDVDGVMTADPRVVPDARTLPHISYAEAAELSYFGAKVLHPKTVLPAVEGGIPVRILNSFNPSHPGTLLTEKVEAGGTAVKGIASIGGLSIVTVEGRGMVGVPGIAGKVFMSVARTDSSLFMISQSSSEQNICFVVQQSNTDRVLKVLHQDLELELSRRVIDRIAAQQDVAIVAVVGAGMKGTPGISAKVFGALGRNRINVVAIAQGSSEYNISLLIAAKDIQDAVRAIHAEFDLGKKD